MKHAISFFLLTFLSLQISACSPAAEGSSPKTPQALQPTVVSTTLFQVIKADGNSLDTWLFYLLPGPVIDLDFRYGVVYPHASHLLFGMIGGLLGALIVLGLRRSSQKPSS